MRLRYNRLLSIAALVVGILLVVLSVVSFRVGTLVLGLVLAALGGLLLVNPVVVLDGGELLVKNALGTTLKRFPVAGPADLRVEGSRLVHVATGQRVANLGFGTDQSDAARWREWVQSGGAGAV